MIECDDTDTGVVLYCRVQSLLQISTGTASLARFCFQISAVSLCLMKGSKDSGCLLFGEE